MLLTLFGPGFNPFLLLIDESLERGFQIQQNDSMQTQSSLLKNIWQLIALRTKNIQLMGNIVWVNILVILYGLAILSHKSAIDHENLPLILVLLTVIVYFPTISALNLDGYSRFRVPVMPVICVFSGLGLTWLLETVGYKRNYI